MLYFNIKEQSEHRARLDRLQDALASAMQTAYACFYAPLVRNETPEDRAVHVKELLFEQASSALVNAWDGDGADFLEHMRLLFEQSRGVTIEPQTVISVPVVAKVVTDAQGNRRIEWTAQGE